MLNWLSSGVVNIAGYISPFVFLIAAFVWFVFVKRNVDIRQNKKILIKIGVVSIAGALISPLLIIVFSGNLFPFLASSWKIIQQITNFATFKAVVSVAFRGFSMTGGILVLSVVLLFVLKDAKKLTFAILYPFPLFAALSRINCFLKGCCFGKLYNGVFAVTYPPASNVSRQHYLRSLLPSRYVESLPVHPTQLYIVFSMLFLFVFVTVMNKFKVKKNIIAGTVLIGYGFLNFFIEFIREEPVVLKFFTMGQAMDIILFLLGLHLLFKVKEEDVVLKKQ